MAHFSISLFIIIMIVFIRLSLLLLFSGFTALVIIIIIIIIIIIGPPIHHLIQKQNQKHKIKKTIGPSVFTLDCVCMYVCYLISQEPLGRLP